MDRAEALYPSQTFILKKAPSNIKSMKSASLEAMDPKNIRILSQDRLHLIIQVPTQRGFLNFDALIHGLIAEAEIGKEGIKHPRNQQRLREIFQALGSDVSAAAPVEFLNFVQGVGLTPDIVQRLAIHCLNVANIVSAYNMTARMAEQAA